ncbi:hypothetical protein [Mongoliitalea lutea]|uniref:Uncharacterized protein n=1 Tax=Mongoliitalea lutea TaxID=849756 RepID=A0A8J3CX61_9BACT|nr:hypothetical protein [Mongoliitalea lutea]GHB32364.1 hypothetical protein GCM10008106_11690 [Mongoliitalea lutea]
MSKIDYLRAENISKNLQLIMKEADLTVDGIVEFTKVSKPTIDRAILKLSNISPNKLNEIALSFGLTSSQISNKYPVKTSHIPKLQKLINFKSDDSANPKYFISLSKIHNAHRFVKDQLLTDTYFREERRLSEIKTRLKSHNLFVRSFSDSALEQAIKRIAEEFEWFKISRKSPKGKVFYYKVLVLNSPIQ